MSQVQPFRWAIAGYGSVAAGGHHQGILRNQQTLVGFTTTKRAVQHGDTSRMAFNMGPVIAPFDASRMIVAGRPDDEWLERLRGNVDAIVVSTSSPTHLEVAGYILKAGFDCFVEKPLALNFKDGNRINEIAKAAGRKLLVAHVLPAIAPFAYLRKMILEKGLENLRTLTMERYVPWSLVEADDPKAHGEGFFMDLGIHDLHFVASLGADATLSGLTPKKRFGNLQFAEVKINLDGFDRADVTVKAGATEKVTGFYHGFFARFSDTSTLTYDGTVLKRHTTVIELPAQPPADFFGDELILAAGYFRGEKDPGYLGVDYALRALQIIGLASS